jgi:hypothetical protein
MKYITTEFLAFWTLSIVEYSKNMRTTRFGKWICFHHQVRGETPNPLVPLGRDHQ